MELILNLLWVAVAIGACACWLRFPAETRNRCARFNQVIALAMLLVVLFPVISVTDDLQAATFPAETEGAARRMLQAAHVPVPLAMHAVRIAVITIFPPAPTFAAHAIRARASAPVRLTSWLQPNAIRPPPVA